MKKTIESIKDIVAYCLENYPETRSSDNELIFRVLLEKGIACRNTNGIMISYQKIQDLFAIESIRRTRQKFQENGLYLPSEEVQEERKQKEKEMHQINQWWPDIGTVDGHQTILIEEEYL